MGMGRSESFGLGSRARIAAGVLLAAVVSLLALAGESRAQIVASESLPGGVQRTTYRLGPVTVTPGQNQINYRPILGASRPNVNGWITRIKPDLVNPDGTVPKSSLVMFHHGVWVNNSVPASDQLFYATGEEKTIMQLPEGFGYQYKTSDFWLLNDMIHNLTPQPMELYFQYTLDFIPATAPEAADIVRARPIWMDVQSGIYPVFDVWRDSGGADGEVTYPQDFPDAYPAGVQKNVKTVLEPGVLLHTTGHVHTGGLSTNLYLRREGATYQGPVCPERKSYDDRLKPLRKKVKSQKSRVKKTKKLGSKLKLKRKRILRNKKVRSSAKGKREARRLKRKIKANRKLVTKLNRQKATTTKQLKKVEGLDRKERARDAACRDSQPKVDDGNRVHLFNSKANYFDPRGPISWDMAMYSTDENWRVRVKQGDKLELQTTYETKIASWPESMGINVVYWASDNDLAAVTGSENPESAPDPYATKVDQVGVLNHPHLPENEDYGGELPTVGPDPTTLPDGQETGGPFEIADYLYNGADFRLPGNLGRPPVVNQGQSFTFKLSQDDINNEVWHSLTSCKTPCNKSTGISYPIPDGEFQFESGQMGPGQPPTVGYTEWSTPKSLPKGTYTFFCRIHPLMRGAFRVK